MAEGQILHVRVDRSVYARFKEIANKRGLRHAALLRLLISDFVEGKVSISDIAAPSDHAPSTVNIKDLLS